MPDMRGGTARMARWAATVAVAAAVLVPAAQGLSGNPVQVNASAAGDQDGGPVAAGAGSYVTVFTSDVAGSTVLLRRFAADGTPLTGDVQVDTTTNQQNYDLDVAAAPDGRFVVVWAAFDLVTNESRIVARFYAANGAPVTGEVNVATANHPLGSSVSMAADGNAVVAWEAANNILARRYGPTGAALTGALSIAGTALNETGPRVAAQPDDGFVVMWDLYHPAPADNEDVMIGRFAPDGSVRTAPALAGGDLDDREGPGDVVAAGDGSIVAGWTVGNAGSVALWRRYAADLTPLTAALGVGAEPGVDQDLSSVSLLPSGGVAVAWDRYVTTSQDPEMRRFAADGTPTSDIIVGASSTAGYQGGAGLATQPSGAQALVWTADSSAAGDGDGDTVLARFLSGTEGGSGPPAPAPTPSPQPTPAPPAPRRASLPKLTSFVTLPSAKRCVSRRHFKIHIRQPKTVKIVKATVVLNRKRVATRTGKRVTSVIDLRSLPKGTFTVKITVTTADKRTITGKRSYHTCAAKRSGHGPSKL
jgi:hypothetical protein